MSSTRKTSRGGGAIRPPRTGIGLKWKSHIRNVENTISRHIGLIRRAEYLLDSRCLLLLYNAFVLPFLNYCVQIWGSTYDTNFLNLITAQKKAIRIVDHAGWRDHTSPIFKKYNVLKFLDLVKISQINVMHNFLRNTLPENVANHFAIYQGDGHRVTRVHQHFTVPFAPTNYRKFSIYVAAPNTWNKIIAAQIPNINDIPLSKSFFKKVSKKIFIDHY